MEKWDGMCGGTGNGFISEGRKSGDREAEAVLCAAVGRDNLLSLVETLVCNWGRSYCASVLCCTA